MTRLGSAFQLGENRALLITYGVLNADLLQCRRLLQTIEIFGVCVQCVCARVCVCVRVENCRQISILGVCVCVCVEN